MNEADISDVTMAAMAARHAELAPHLVRTPSVPLSSARLGMALVGAQIWAKLECFQHTGTFKARGALSVISVLPDDKRAAGITAASAGNHAIAAAWAARQFGLSAKVVMQNTANPLRIARARAEGAELVMRDPGAPTFAEAERLVRDEGRTFVHPFEGINTTLGTAGVGIEFLQDVPGLEVVIVAVGGGGLISGIAAAIKAMNPACKVYGVEPEGADSMSQSLKAGHPVTLEKTQTIADSLAPPMALPMGFALTRTYVDQIVTVTDDQICAGMVLLAEEARLAVEPAVGAVMAAALGPLRGQLAGRRIGLVICGANIDAGNLCRFYERGMPHVAGLLEI
ncbi:MAG: threonine/serine dehydratase [Paracoccaceae bacterium]